jgi:hypothetical protein
LPVSAEVIAYIRSAAVALLGVVVATLCILAVGVFGDYYAAYPAYAPIMLTRTLGVDVYGALVPLVSALLFAVLFLKLAKSPFRKLALAFSVSTLLAFTICRQTADGVAGYPLLYAFLVSVVAAGVNLYPRPNRGLSASMFASLALTMFCVPLSLFAVDLAYSPYYVGAVIGGNGLTDGLLLSTLYAPLAAAIVFSAVTYVTVTFNLVKMTQIANSIKQPKKLCPATSNTHSQTIAE